jgi:phosphoglycerol transferase MdoB-like AlkP superfamily enzyme
MKPSTPFQQALRPYLRFLALALVFLSAFRLVLLLWQGDRVGDSGGFGYILLQGVRFDLVLLGLLMLIPGVVLPWLLVPRATFRFGMAALRFWFLTGFAWLMFMELATPSFIEEYDTRPNYLFVEYLRYPREVLSTLWGAYRWPMIFAAIAMPLTIWAVRRKVFRACTLDQPLRFLPTLGMSLGFLVLCFAAVRSTTDHRPVNPSTVAFSGDAMINTLPLSSGYTLLYALYESRLEAEGGFHYGKMAEADVFRHLYEGAGLDPAEFTDPDIPTLHAHQASRDLARPLNFVIVLEESLGAEYVGCMGGPPITPKLDRLKDQGIWLENLYATGTRSVRGIEAVVTGFLPTPARSVVKLPRSQRDFFTIAELLKREGYATSFLYGGEAHFDNMRRFFTGNGFQYVIDENDFDDPIFTGSWGVSDEDLFNRAHEYFESMGDQPFFSLIFTSSNHSPFEFPDGRIELHDTEKQTVLNAVKYADWALGDYFDKARESSYWQNTVFLVVADHNSRVRGASLVPIQRFHIPGFFLGGSIQPEIISTVASQIDLIPTALSLIGMSADTPTIGRDLTRPAQRTRPGRAIMQYHSSQAYMENDRVIVYQRGVPGAQYRWDGSQLIAATEAERDPALMDRALAHSLWPQLAYPAGNYRLR